MSQGDILVQKMSLGDIFDTKMYCNVPPRHISSHKMSPADIFVVMLRVRDIFSTFLLHFPRISTTHFNGATDFSGLDERTQEEEDLLVDRHC